MDVQEVKEKKKELEYKLTEYITSETQRFMNETGVFIEDVVLDKVSTRVMADPEVKVLVVSVFVKVAL